jgi:AcrR family transcriptional regulator
MVLGLAEYGFDAAECNSDERMSSMSNVASELAHQSLASREAQYASEVRRLVDAALEVMRRSGTAASPRVADIVAAAGLSNDAFYRHFASKEALVAAILEDGSARLSSYLDHQMAKASKPSDQVRRFVEGVMSQAADEDIAATTRAVLWNGGTLSVRLGSSRSSPAASLAPLLREPFAQLGSADPDADAMLVAHAAVGTLSDFLWRRARPTRAEIDHFAEFCLAAVSSPPRSASDEVGKGDAVNP